GEVPHVPGQLRGPSRRQQLSHVLRHNRLPSHGLLCVHRSQIEHTRLRTAIAKGRQDMTTAERPATASIWMRPERSAAGRPAQWSRAEITGAALRIADAEGLDAVSMRRVAAELGTGAASLYR